FQLFANIETAHARHHDVEHDQIRRVVQSTLKTTDAVARANHVVTFILEVVAQPGDHRGLVFDNEDLALHTLASYAALAVPGWAPPSGNDIVNLLPRPGVLSSSTSPP